MKLFLFSLLFLSHYSLAGNQKILKCLGNEEKRFHLKKETGPLYDLNQRLIAEMLQIPHAELSPEDYAYVCESGQGSESLALLEKSITNSKTLFILPRNLDLKNRSMNEGLIKEYVEAVREIFLSFISQVQALSPNPTCLKDYIPELNTFFNEIKYLQEDIELVEIFKGKDQQIFKKLKHYSSAFEKCREEMSKKAKSESTEEPKKR